MQSEGHLLLRYLQAAQRVEVGNSCSACAAVNFSNLLLSVSDHLRAEAAIITGLHQQINNAQIKLAKVQADIAFLYHSQESGGGDIPQHDQQQQQLLYIDYWQIHPEVTVLYPPDAVQQVYNRRSMLQDVADLNLSDAYGKAGQLVKLG